MPECSAITFCFKPVAIKLLTSFFRFSSFTFFPAFFKFDNKNYLKKIYI